MSGSSGDRLRGAIASLVEHLLEPRVVYLASYPARVVLQNDDGSLELAPDDARLPGLSRVPVRGLPGVSVRVREGARVLVGFENGDPRTPIATLFEAAGLEELRIEAAVAVRLSAPTVVLADGGAPVARLGDAVQVLTSTGPAFGAIVSGRDAVLA